MNRPLNKYILIVSCLLASGLSFYCQDAKAKDLSIEENIVLLSRAHTLRNFDSRIVKREISGSGTGQVEEVYLSAAKVRIGKKIQSRMVKLESEGKNPCRALRRLLLRKNRDALTFRLNSCSPSFEEKAALLPNDVYVTAGYLWGLNGEFGTNAPRAWEITTGSHNVVVGVIDTGVETDHPDLAANIWTNSGEIADNGIDDDGNGYIDDVHGINAIDNTGALIDDHGHGTHVSGTIGAVGDNGIGVAGINWNVGIAGCKFLSSSGSGTTSNAIKCVDYFSWLKESGVNIVALNNSWGGTGYSASLAAAIARATNDGILFVAAAGNRATNIDRTAYYPARYPGVISVAAIDSSGSLASFSNFGQVNVPIAAPGVSTLSTYLNGQYAYMSGTSMATPHVTGVLALMAAAAPTLDAASLKEALLSSAVQLSSLSGSVENQRQLRADTAVAAVSSFAPAPSITPDPIDDSEPALTPTPEPTISPTPTKREDKAKRKKKKRKARKKARKKDKRH